MNTPAKKEEPIIVEWAAAGDIVVQIDKHSVSLLQKQTDGSGKLNVVRIPRKALYGLERALSSLRNAYDRLTDANAGKVT